MKKASMFKDRNGVNYLIPFLLIATLYLLWGLAHGLLDVLNKHFQEAFAMSKAESGFVQFSVYIGYFVMALPAGWVMRKVGYKRGIITGLLIFALGALLFVPASFIHSPMPFFAALFILACGLCLIENGAHPCATGMGDEQFAAQRINIAAAFNGVGWIVGPLIGGLLIFGGDGSPFDLAKPYILVGSFVLLVCLVFAFVRIPEAEMAQEEQANALTAGQAEGSVWSHPHFKWALLAQFLYVGAQTGIGSYFVNYVLELDPAISKQSAALMLSMGGMGLFFVGRLLSSLFMRWVSPGKLLALFGSAATICMALVMLSVGKLSLVALYLSFFFMSTMFPTIFALGVKGMGAETKRASSLLVMCIVGGAVFPIVMGLLGKTNMAAGFALPLIAFAFITLFGVMNTSKRG
ncbi:MAG: sugar MFS transporter [Alistipes sp.]|nr:sugar MFS transporter [Alistipes sp.]